MTVTGVDYAWGRPSVDALRGAGAVFACRYLSYDTSGKNLTRDEADQLRAGGISPVSNWEAAGNWAEFSGGYEAGRRHALEAERQHLACGGPPGRPIYFSTDWDVLDSQLPAVGEYYRGAASVLGVGRTGAYGGYRVIQHLFDAGRIAWGWQTYAWSAGRWDARAQLRQVRNGVYIDGVDCDIDEAQAADYGQWGLLEGDDMSEQLENIAWAIALGVPQFETNDGKRMPNVLHDWEVARTKRELALAATVTALHTELAELRAKVDALALGGVDVGAVTDRVVAGVAEVLARTGLAVRAE